MLKLWDNGSFSLSDDMAFVSTGEFIPDVPRPSMLGVIVPMMGAFNIKTTNSTNMLNMDSKCYTMLFARGWQVRVA